MTEEIGFENGRNSNFEGLVTLTLTLDPVIRHTVVHHSSTCTYIPNFIEIEETFCGRTDVRTYGRTFFPPLILLGRLLEVDLKSLLFLREGDRIWCREWDSEKYRLYPHPLPCLTLPSGEDILPLSAEASNGPNAHPRINHKVTKSPSVVLAWVYTNNGTIPFSKWEHPLWLTHYHTLSISERMTTSSVNQPWS